MRAKAGLVSAASPAWRWKCDETVLPLAEASGKNHKLTSVSGGTMEFGRTSMRSDGTGKAISEASGSNMTGSWTPTITAVGGNFTLAMLCARDVSAANNSDIDVRILGALAFQYSTNGTGAQQPPRFLVWNGSTWVDASNTALNPTAAASFVAIRVATGGAWKVWHGDKTATGTTATYTPAAVWQVWLFINQIRCYKVQEIQAWNVALSDAAVQAVRFELTGV